MKWSKETLDYIAPLQIAGPTGAAGAAGAIGAAGPARILEVQEITLTSGDASAKFVTLAFAPLFPDDVLVDTIHGCGQKLNIDFIVSGNTINWNGFGLDTLLAAGDVLRITYLRN